MNDLKVFSNSEFGELGVLIIDGKEWFPAHQCAALLGYSNPRDAVRRHCKSEGVVKHDTPTESGVQPINYINEGNLYRLIVHSKLPKAVEFEKWIFDTVLPSIRHNGDYVPNAEELIAKTAAAVVSEVMKQLVPFISQITQPQTQFQPQPQPQQYIMSSTMSVSTPFKKELMAARYCYGNNPSTIDLLDDDLKAQVHAMMASGLYSSEKISNFLAEHGIKLSQVAVCKYKRNHFKIIKGKD